LFIEPPLSFGARNVNYYRGEYYSGELRIDKTSHLAVRSTIFAKMTLGMPADNIPLMDLESAIAGFCAAGSLAPPGEALFLPGWHDEDWKRLFRFTSTRRVRAGDALIRGGEPDRTLYFVLHGELEVIAHSGDGLTMGRVALVGAGSLLGELAFFDGGPRSAGAWAVDDCEVAAMTPDQYTAFEQSNPALARELLFALGRILAIRLRRTTTKVVR
jgi:CRP/FNR family transcriptional regulator, cyclic AMP receptor protein